MESNDYKEDSLRIAKAFSDAYYFHVSESDRLRRALAEQVSLAHKNGASDREIAECVSLSRARVQQLRTGK